MNKRNAIVVALIVGIIAVATPIMATLYLARKQSITSQMAVVGKVASDVLRRADETGDQGEVDISKLNATLTSDPCSSSQIQEMGALAVASDELQGIAYVANDELYCSSLGHYGLRLPLDPPDYTSATGYDVRSSVQLPLISDKRFTLLVQGHNGYGSIIDPQLLFDLTLPNDETSLGVYSYSGQHLMAHKGHYETRWMDKLGNAYAKDFVDDGYLVSLRRSRHYDIVSLAAIPTSSADPILKEEAETLVPLGVLAGLALAGAVLYMARIQLALPAVLKTALRRKEFYVVYQPIVDLQTRQWVGAEVLVRWKRPSGEMVRPDLFIPVAEDTGLIPQITREIFEIVGHETLQL